MIFLRERLRPLQVVALALAIVAVLYLTWDYGRFPWIALTLAFAFGFYSLVHKLVAVSSITGLTFEMLLLSGPALAYLLHLNGEGTGSFLHAGTEIDLLFFAFFFAHRPSSFAFHPWYKTPAPVDSGFSPIHCPQLLFAVGGVLFR